MTAIRAEVAATDLAGTGRIVFSPQNNVATTGDVNTLTSDPMFVPPKQPVQRLLRSLV